MHQRRCVMHDPCAMKNIDFPHGAYIITDGTSLGDGAAHGAV